MKTEKIKNANITPLIKADFAGLLWEFFKAIIYGVLDQFSRTIGYDVLSYN